MKMGHLICLDCNGAKHRSGVDTRKPYNKLVMSLGITQHIFIKIRKGEI